MKLIAAAVIVLGCGYVGLLFASRFAMRVNQIEEISLWLSRMMFNISFLKMPVKESLFCSAKASKGCVNLLLLDVAKTMENGLSTNCAWEMAIGKNKNYLCFAKEELDILEEFIRNLGKGDIENEMNNIKATQAKLALIKALAEGERDTKGKLFKGVGVLFGMFVAVLLI